MAATRILAYASDRAEAKRWIEKAPVNSRVTVAGPKRSTDQNAAMWSALTDISQQHLHAGLRLTPEDWKIVFSSTLKRELRLVPNIDGTGLVQLGLSTSQMSKAEMSELLEMIYATGAEWGVQFHEPNQSSGRSGGGVNNPPPGRAERVEAA